ncbi:MAG: hypothetical protein K0S56_4746 [Microvirga sp.]|jgi:Ca2+-binding RTX toxin-like protein|nr:hypothetical protein [Microvirga sp.]
MWLGAGNGIYRGAMGTTISVINVGDSNDTALWRSRFRSLRGNQGDDYLDGGAGIDTVSLRKPFRSISG